MEQISLIADDAAPQCVSRKHGRTNHLFKFLADKFLGAPDSVGESEGIHALWQKLEGNRTRMKMPLLNALLKLRSYNQHYGDLPSYEDLLPYITTVEEELTVMYADARGPNYASIWRDAPFLERFNIDSNMVAQFQGDNPENASALAPSSTGGSADVAWGNYVRFLLKNMKSTV